MGISGRDKISNHAVLKRVNLPSLKSALTQKNLRWLEHLGRIPITAYLLSGKCKQEKPRLGLKTLRSEI